MARARALSPASIEGKTAGTTPTNDFGLLPIPRRLRYDPDKPFHFGLLLNASFGFASTFLVGNLYYCQPLLIQLSKSFNVTYSEVSMIPTLIQAGYAAGLLLISPLGDLVRRRQLILLLILLSTTLTIGLAVTPNFFVFEALCFLIGVASITPPMLMPLAADLAPPERRASALSVILSGVVLGVLITRVISGVIGNFNDWRIVYYVAIGVQCLVLVSTYFTLPDLPAKNRELTYLNILYTTAKYAVTEPLLVQSALINMASSACFSGFWVSLTFLLGGPPYNYSTLDIGLFGLVGMFGVLVGPIGSRLMGNLVPWYATLVATFVLVVFQAVQTAAGGFNISAVVIACFGLDAGRQMLQVSLATAVFSISTAARSRLNAVLLLSIFVGQVIGTSVGSQIFIQYGWRACSLFLLGLYCFQLGILFLRGPHCPRRHWFGWVGGFGARKNAVGAWRKDETSKSAHRNSIDDKMEEGTVRQMESGDTIEV